MIYKFNVKWYCEYDETEMVDEGFLVAKSFASAMGAILDEFDDSEIMSVKLDWVEDSNLLRYATIAEGIDANVNKENELGPQLIEALGDLIDASEEAE